MRAWGEPVITLHGVIWTVEQGRSEGRHRSSVHLALCGRETNQWALRACIHVCVRALPM